MSRKNISVIDPPHFINKAIVCSGSNNVDHINAEVLNGLENRLKINVDPSLPGLYAKIHSPFEFQVISNIFLFI
jgi:hypothetical protein